MRVTSAPRARAASAIATPCLPLDRLPRKRTGSSGSRVPPAVTTTRRPARSLRGARMPRRRARAARRDDVVGLRHAARAAVGAGELADRGTHDRDAAASGASRCSPAVAGLLPHLGVHRRARSRAAPSLASTVLPSRSSASPAASFAIVFAVAGAIDDEVGGLADRDVPHLGDALVELGVHGVAADRLERRSTDEPQRGLGRARRGRRARRARAPARRRRPCTRRCRR